MSYVMTSEEFVKKARDIAKNYKTAYLLGTFGWSCTSMSIARAIESNKTNAARPAWQSRAKKIVGQGYLFDCCGLAKGILWGWSGKLSMNYGGAKYGSNGVPDIGADYLIKRCPNGGSTNFKDMVPGEMVWMTGHMGIYLGDGLVAEATPAWDGGVQISVCTNLIASKAGYTKKRKWTRHGKLPWVDYSKKSSVTETVKPVTSPVNKDTETRLQIKAAVDKMVKAGVNITPNYWVENYNKLNYLDALIIKIGDKIVKSGERCSSVNEAINNLVNAGVINSGDYWLSNHGKLKYVDELFLKVGNCQYK